MDVLLIDDADLIRESPGNWEKKKREKSHLPSAAVGFVRRTRVGLFFCRSLSPLHRLLHVNICFRLPVRWNDRNAISPKSPSVPWRAYHSRQCHSSPQSGGNLSVVEMDIDKQTAGEQWRRQPGRAATGASFVSFKVFYWPVWVVLCLT